jgi:hypothetical protein
MQDANSDRGVRVPQANGGELALVIKDDSQVAGSALCRCAHDRTIPDPGMASPYLAKRVVGHVDSNTFRGQGR